MSNTSELVKRAAAKNGETCNGRLLIKLLRMVNWREVSSQELNSDEMLEARTVRLVSEQPPGLFTEHTDKFVIDDDDLDSDTVAESDMSVVSRSLLHRVNDRVRKVQDQSSKMQHKTATNILEYGEFYVFNIWSICIHGKELLRQFTFHQKHREQSHDEQMFDISEKLIVGQSDDIYGVTPTNWEDSSWKR